MPQARLTKEPWILSASGAQTILDSLIANNIALGDIATISEGVVTGLNDLYLLPSEDSAARSSLFKPCLRGREIRRYTHTTPNELLFYPYKQVGSKTVLIPESTIEKVASTFMERIREEKTRILARPYFANSSKEWYELWNQRKGGIFDVEKVVTPELADRARFAVAKAGIYYGDTVCGIIPKDPMRLSPAALVTILNSSVVQWYYKKATVPKANGFFIYKVMFLKNVPVPSLSAAHEQLLRRLGELVGNSYPTKDGPRDPSVYFLENLIDACVMECYFREHMAERNLLFLDELTPHLANYDANASETKQREFLEHLYRTLNAPKAKIRNNLIRISAESPELLGVILKEGRV